MLQMKVGDLKMDGTMYRLIPKWFPGAFMYWVRMMLVLIFTGDGVDDYGMQIPLSPQPNNVKNFFDTG